MLAAKVKSTADLRYPLLGNPKIDGIRCLKVNGKAVTRAFKPIQNHHIREYVETHFPDGVDGELVVPGGTFQQTASAIMSRDGAPDFLFMAFDFFGGDQSMEYRLRVSQLAAFVEGIKHIQLVEPTPLADEAALLRYEEECLRSDWEGVMLRDPDGPYRQGRSTLREGYLMKLKRYADSDAVVLGFEEARENCNPVVPNAFGLARRPGGSALKLPKGTLGTLLVRDVHSGVEFGIGTGQGLTAELRQHVWDNQLAYLGRTIVYRYQPTGVKDKPRFPSFLGFREDLT